MEGGRTGVLPYFTCSLLRTLSSFLSNVNFISLDSKRMNGGVKVRVALGSTHSQIK